MRLFLYWANKILQERFQGWQEAPPTFSKDSYCMRLCLKHDPPRTIPRLVAPAGTVHKATGHSTRMGLWIWQTFWSTLSTLTLTLTRYIYLILANSCVRHFDQLLSTSRLGTLPQSAYLIIWQRFWSALTFLHWSNMLWGWRSLNRDNKPLKKYSNLLGSIEHSWLFCSYSNVYL